MDKDTTRTSVDSCAVSWYNMYENGHVTFNIGRPMSEWTLKQLAWKKSSKITGLDRFVYMNGIICINRHAG